MIGLPTCSISVPGDKALFQDFQAIDTGREGSVTMEQIDASVRQSSR